MIFESIQNQSALVTSKFSRRLYRTLCLRRWEVELQNFQSATIHVAVPLGLVGRYLCIVAWIITFSWLNRSILVGQVRLLPLKSNSCRKKRHGFCAGFLKPQFLDVFQVHKSFHVKRIHLLIKIRNLPRLGIQLLQQAY